MNKRKLNAIMQLHGEFQQDLARYLQLSLSRLNAKINEYRGAQFRQNEIAAIQEHYSLSAEEVNEIFFCHSGIFKRYCPPCYPGEERMSRRKWSLLIGLIGSVVFNVGWWISYPPMVFAGVLLAAAGLDLWIER